MKHISSNKYTVAWFKLAECVSRGEKERAFGVYRLLSHSLDDQALAIQLGGDLFLAFAMPTQAMESYEKAAHVYRQGGRLLEAVSVYEHLRALEPENNLYKKSLLSLYGTLQFDERVGELACELACAYVKAGQFDTARTLVKAITKLESFAAQAQSFERLVCVCYRGKISSQLFPLLVQS